MNLCFRMTGLNLVYVSCVSVTSLVPLISIQQRKIIVLLFFDSFNFVQIRTIFSTTPNVLKTCSSFIPYPVSHDTLSRFSGDNIPGQYVLTFHTLLNFKCVLLLTTMIPKLACIFRVIRPYDSQVLLLAPSIRDLVLLALFTI